MPYPRRSPGQSNEFIFEARIWTDISLMLNEWKAGRFRPRADAGFGIPEITLSNSTNNNVDTYKIMQIQTLATADMPESSYLDSFHESPVFTVIDPVWHTSIDNLVICPGVVAGGSFAWHPQTWGTVSVTVDDEADTYVMVDPDDTNKMKTSDTGPWKILGLDTQNNLATVDLMRGSPFWKYELTETIQTPDPTAAKLLRIDGAVFAESVELEDPDGLMDDQGTGDTGWCILIGNSFYAIQAPC